MALSPATRDVSVRKAETTSSAPLSTSSKKSVLPQLDHHPESRVSESVARRAAWLGKWIMAHRPTRASAAKWVKRRTHFHTLHAACFAFLIVLATFALWLSPKQASISFVDALYNATSAVCVTGLMSIDIRAFSVFDQFVIVLSMLLGSHIVASMVPLYVRRSYLSTVLRDCRCHRPKESSRKDQISPTDSHGIPASPPRSNSNEEGIKHVTDSLPQDNTSQDPEPANAARAWKQEHVAISMEALRALEGGKCNHDGTISEHSLRMLGSECPSDSICARRHLEHRALTTLGWLVPFYFLGVQVLGFAVVQLCVWNGRAVYRIVEEDNRVQQTVYSVFSSASAFTNAGFSLLEDSMVPLQTSGSFLLVVYGLLILLGNTMFPPALRLLISVHHKWAKGSSKHVYQYLLDHPRDCYTHLFPLRETVWLVVTVTSFNALEICVFCVLEWRSKAFNQDDSAGDKLLAGAFQSVNSRTAGMNVVDLVDLTPPMLVLYLGMMYLAAYPLFIFRESTSSNESSHGNSHASLLQQSHAWESDACPDSNLVLVSRRLVARDSVFLFISVFLVCLVDNRRMQEDPVNFSMFNIMFEVISAYSNVGLSVGYSCNRRTSLSASPCTDVQYSFSGKWRALNKVVLVVVMFVGRHRGLPDNSDRAIRLPSHLSHGPAENKARKRSWFRFTDQLLLPKSTPSLPYMEDTRDAEEPLSLASNAGAELKQ